MKFGDNFEGNKKSNKNMIDVKSYFDKKNINKTCQIGLQYFLDLSWVIVYLVKVGVHVNN